MIDILGIIYFIAIICFYLGMTVVGILMTLMLIEKIKNYKEEKKWN